MVSSSTEEKVWSIWTQDESILRIFFVGVCVFEIFFFVSFFYYDALGTKITLNLLTFNSQLLAIWFLFLIGFVVFFAAIRNMVEFHVRCFACPPPRGPEQQRICQRCRENPQRESEMKYTFPLFVAPVIISLILGLGVIFFIVAFIFTHYYDPSLWGQLTSPPMTMEIGDVIVGTTVATILILYVAYHFGQRERVQKKLSPHNVAPLIFFPIAAAILSPLWVMWDLMWYWYNQVLNNAAPAAWTPNFALNIAYLASQSALFVTGIVMFYLAFHIVLEREYFYKHFSTIDAEQNFTRLIREGLVIFPQTVRSGDSQSLLLDLQLSDGFLKRPRHLWTSDSAVAELQAAGIDIDGEKRSTIFESSSPITWSCGFSSSGRKTINLIISHKVTNDSSEVLLESELEVTVNSFLSVAWAPALALITPILVVLVGALVTSHL